jgi:hypothetical protein
MPANIGAVVYGVIAVGALLAAESAQRETYGETVAAIALAAVLYWLAHGYAGCVTRRVQEGTRLTAAGLARALLHELPILLGAALPVLAVLIAWVAGARLDGGIYAALWTAAGTIVIAEVVAGVRAELSGGEVVVQALVGSVLGLLVLAMRLVLH